MELKLKSIRKSRKSRKFRKFQKNIKHRLRKKKGALILDLIINEKRKEDNQDKDQETKQLDQILE